MLLYEKCVKCKRLFEYNEMICPFCQIPRARHSNYCKNQNCSTNGKIINDQLMVCPVCGEKTKTGVEIEELLE